MKQIKNYFNNYYASNPTEAEDQNEHDVDHKFPEEVGDGEGDNDIKGDGVSDGDGDGDIPDSSPHHNLLVFVQRQRLPS